MTTVLLAIGFIALFFVLMSVRLIFLRNGEFKGTCASQSPFLNKEETTCGYCGKQVAPGDSCADPEKHQSEVEKVLTKFD